MKTFAAISWPLLSISIAAFVQADTPQQAASGNDLPVVEAQAPPQAESLVGFRLISPTDRIDVVLDSDMYNEVDDQFALAYALHSAERIDLKAVCATPFLNHRSKSSGDGMEQSYQETFRVLQLLEHSAHDFVFRGATRFLANRHTPVDCPAARRIIELAKRARKGRLYVVGLGAATNIASALLIDPSIGPRIVVVWIGGHPYHWAHARDFNLKQDIAAAQVLFDCGVTLVHIPAGDVAASLTITLPELESGLKGKSPIASKLFDNVERYYTETGANQKRPRSGENAWDKVIWDIATVAWVVAPEKLVNNKVVDSPVLTDLGTWNRSEHRHKVRVAFGLDRGAIYQDLFAKLGKPYLPSPVIERIEFDWKAHKRLAPLQFQDGDLFGSRDGAGVNTSPRNVARVGWFWLNQGNWSGKQLLPPEYFQDYMKPGVPRDLPRTKQDGNDYLGIGNYGGGNDQNFPGQGVYGFNWWFNAKISNGESFLPSLPDDAFCTIGHQGNEVMVIVPSWKTVVAARGNWGGVRLEKTKLLSEAVLDNTNVLRITP